MSRSDDQPDRAQDTVRVHGIPNCDTVKRARAWLASRGVAAAFIDFRKDGVPAALDAWVASLGVDALLNRRGTTWRKLSDTDRAAAETTDGAVALMRREPSVIKRPVVVWTTGEVTAGFDEADWTARCD